MFRYVFHLQGEHSAISSKPDASAKLLFTGPLVCSSPRRWRRLYVKGTNVLMFFLKRLVLLQMVGYSMYIILIVLKLFL